MKRLSSLILQSILLALIALIAYWAATIPGLTGENGWAFRQGLFLQTIVLTLYYGAWFFAFNYAWKKVTA